MSFYQEIRTAKAAAIGTIMPWVGNISDIPDGWIVCDGTQVSAKDFPLLARAIGDTYNLSTTVTQGLINTFANNASTEAGRIPDTYIYSPIDGSGGGATFAVIVADAGTQAGGAPNGVGGTVTVQRLQQGANYEINDILTIPSGNSGGGSDILITVATVEEGSVSTFGGEFPSYQGEIVLPALINRPLVDMEQDYLGPGSPTGRVFDLDSTSVSEISSFIGVNSDTGVPTSFNDVATDVVFELNERTTAPAGDSGEISYYYSGKLQANTIVTGSGQGNRVMFFGPRKLGRGHIKGHGHGGRIDTIVKDPETQPGEGVIPWSNINYNFDAQVDTSDSDIFITNDNEFQLEYNMSDQLRGRSGFGGGIPGRVIGAINAENPPVNWTPQNVAWTPIKSVLTHPLTHRTFNEGVGLKKGALSGGIAGFNKGPGQREAVDYGQNGQQITQFSNGLTNWYPDLLEYNGDAEAGALADPSAFNTYDTFNSNAGWDFKRTTIGVAASRDIILAHTHDEFDVSFDLSGLRPLNSLNVYVTAPAGNLNLDNARNVGVFQINFNTTQPGMTSVYVIRAY
ncbi:putative short tail fiber [Cyanophage S-RIM44]|uniref:Putative short tail fiber n=1 Tax=Cyanophage S-RIM44 TaxID=1278485 RepID=A0A127KMR2_9CAUD|nr:putative short tail fiber [Cyanophage S-RIM44]AOO11752.1 putative short tail fiber [Cyanophage S-RIM44]AOO12453.1 putative short tail fiber [Cyanophage S-RIM44]AOO12918.1 putative short tail fiber [Cyanophage S-RIM44]